jgi:hypothetical protein
MFALQAAIMFLKRINQIMFVMVKCSEVRTEFLNIIIFILFIILIYKSFGF